MRWEDERYVRIYTRNTPDWMGLHVHTRGLLALLLREVDRAGILPLGKAGPRGLANILRADWEDIEPYLEELLVDGCVVIHGGVLCIVNFIEAQEAKHSDRARQQAARERARDKARVAEKKPSDIADGLSHAVTPGHTASRPVTPIRADPIRAEPSEERDGACAPPGSGDPAPTSASPGGAPDAAHQTPTEPVEAAPPAPDNPPPAQAALPLLAPVEPKPPKPPPLADRVLARYLVGWHRVVMGTRVPVLTGPRRKLIANRLRDGFTEADLMSAAEGVWFEEWNVREKQHSFDLVFRDAKHVEQFANKAAEHARAQEPSAPIPPPPMRPEIRAMLEDAEPDAASPMRGEADLFALAPAIGNGIRAGGPTP